MNKIRTLIVDDEPLARLNIRESLSTFSHWEIVAEFEDGSVIENVIESIEPDVIFLDIQMPNIDGLSLAKRLINSNTCPLIIFVTAFDTYAVQAFELYAIDYLLKPFDNERFHTAIKRVEKTIEHNNQPVLLQNMRKQYFDQQKPLDRILIRSSGSIRIVNVSDILWLSSDGNYVEIHHNEGSHLHRVSLTFLETQLDRQIFLRVHRKAVVRLDAVRELKTLADGKHQAVLSNGDTVNVSKAHKDELLNKLSE